MHIFVGSTNPVKINAVIQAASETWPDVIVKGYEAESRVSNQPRTDEETQRGAENRAVAALKKGLEDSRLRGNDEALGIGMEGGVFENEDGEMWNTVWACVVDPKKQTVFSNGERFVLPEILAESIRQGKEMGPAMDKLVGSLNIKHKEGAIGIITNQFIDRTEMYMGLAKLALGLWYGKGWERTLKTNR